MRPVLVAIALMAAGCASTQVAPLDAPAAKIEADESELWQAADRISQRLDAGGRVDADVGARHYLQSLADRLVATRPAAPPRPVTVRVLASPDSNAFMLANGDLYITIGLLARAESESEVATIFGHETVHYLNRHSLKEVRDTENRRAGSAAFGILMMTLGAAFGGQQGAQAFGNIADSAATQWSLASISGYSRSLETEADEIGLRMMAAGGFDPADAPAVFEHLIDDLDESGEQEPYYYATHPKLAERLANYQSLVATLGPAPPAPAEPAEDAYVAHRVAFLRKDVVLNLDIRRYPRARAEIAALEALRPPDGTTRFLAAEVERRSGGPAGADQALALYREAIGLADPPPDAFRELGLALRSRGDPAHAQYLGEYLARAPAAVDAPLIRRYMEQAPGPASVKADGDTAP